MSRHFRELSVAGVLAVILAAARPLAHDALWLLAKAP